MPVQAIPLALIASLSPLGLTVLLLLAEADRYRGRVLVFLAGAGLCTLGIGFALVFALHGAGLGLRAHRTPRYGLRLAFGLVLLAAAALIARRGGWLRPGGRVRAGQSQSGGQQSGQQQPGGQQSGQQQPGGQQSGQQQSGGRARPRRSGKSRLTTAAREGGLLAAFIVGAVMALPSPSYLSALQDVGSSGLTTAATSAWVVLVVVLTLITIEVPALVLLLAPDWSRPRLAALHAWVGRHGRTLLILVLVVLGSWMFIQGLAGLA